MVVGKNYARFNICKVGIIIKIFQHHSHIPDHPTDVPTSSIAREPTAVHCHVSTVPSPYLKKQKSVSHFYFQK